MESLLSFHIDLTSVADGLVIDTKSDVTTKAIERFVKRVEGGEVIGEIVNAECRNKNDLLDNYNDNVCLAVRSAKYDKKHGMLWVGVEPHGPAKHLLKDLPQTRLRLNTRAAMQISGLRNIITDIITIDVSIVEPQW